MVKKLKKSTNFIKVSSDRVFKDLDKDSDFRTWFIKIQSK